MVNKCGNPKNRLKNTNREKRTQFHVVFLQTDPRPPVEVGGTSAEPLPPVEFHVILVCPLTACPVLSDVISNKI